MGGAGPDSGDQTGSIFFPNEVRLMLWGDDRWSRGARYQNSFPNDTYFWPGIASVLPIFGRSSVECARCRGVLTFGGASIALVDFGGAWGGVRVAGKFGKRSTAAQRKREGGEPPPATGLTGFLDNRSAGVGAGRVTSSRGSTAVRANSSRAPFSSLRWRSAAAAAGADGAAGARGDPSSVASVVAAAHEGGAGLGVGPPKVRIFHTYYYIYIYCYIHCIHI